jgi:carbon-monoxide dehydrogenase medium subunit
MWREYINAASIDEALQILGEYGPAARIIAGGTDLLLELERGSRREVEILVDISRIPGLSRIAMAGGRVHLGPMTTHNHCAVSPLIREYGLPLAQAAWEVGAPQIRNRSTVAGNIITASPANDTITPLMALRASVKLRSLNDEREVPFESFYAGFRKPVLQPGEMLVDISFPALQPNEAGIFIKLGLRRAQAPSSTSPWCWRLRRPLRRRSGEGAGMP